MSIARWSLLAVLIFPMLARAQWTAELGRDATMVVRYDGSRVLSFNYVAWGPNWKYADFKPTLAKADDSGAWPIKGEVKTLQTAIAGSAKQVDGKVVFEWQLNTSAASQGNIGGAVNLTARLAADIFNAKSIDKPTTTGHGWRWTPVAGQTIDIQFDGISRDVAFEKNKVEQARAWIIPGDLSPGEKTVTMTVTLPPGTLFKGLGASRYADVDAKTWLTKTIDWTASPVDLSFLNDKPAGSRGFVKAEGDRFVFADGTEAKFWGCNVQAYALFNATNAAIEQQAKRIAQLGFNLVRIHHHDSADWVSPTVFPKEGNTTQTLDAASLDRIDYWVKCLKDNGVYVWMDLHVGRPFRAGDDIPSFDELDLNKKTGNRQAKGFNYVNARVTELMKQFAKDYLTRTNRYTNTKYVDEPAVMGVLITNENDITDHYGNKFLPDKKLPKHKAMYDALRDPIVRSLKLDGSEAWKTWQPGPSKIVLNEIQYQWSKDFVDYLRTLGVKVPIATTNTWGNDPLFSLPALTAGDVIDVHSYGLAESIGSNPKHDANSAFWIAAAQVAGKPLTITEWNTPAPMRDRFTQPLYIAALSAFQGWDAPMIFGYQQSPLTQPSKIAEWGMSNDPALLPLMPAAALMYRRGDVAPAKETVTFAPTAEDLFNKKLSPETARVLRTSVESHKLQVALPATPLLPWLKESAAGKNGAAGRTTSDPSFDALPDTATDITSDTGQLKRNWGDGVFTIDTPKTQAAVGWIGGQDVTLGDITIKLDTAKAAVAVSSLDGEPIATSKKLLVSVAAQAGEKKAAGILAEPVVGQIVFKNALTSAAALSPSGKSTSPIELTNGTTVDLTGKQATHWFVLTR